MASIVPFPDRRGLSREAALAVIRGVGQEAGNIGWFDHAREMLVERDISMRQALDTFRRGRMIDGPILDEHNEWRCKLVKRTAGRRVQVVIATDGNRSLTVVTVI